jgi:hypothetical protein
MSPKELAALDRDLAGALPALRRAAAAARRLSVDTGTPFHVFKAGRVVDLNADGRKRRPASATSRSRR